MSTRTIDYTGDKWTALTEQQRELVRDWVSSHHIEPNDVPLQQPIEFDADTGEWVFPLYSTRDGKRYIDPETGEPAVEYVRRQWWIDPPLTTQDRATA